MSDQARARISDPFSSHAAAAEVDVSQLEAIVCGVLRSRGVWMTVLEIARDANLHPWSVSPRMRPLCRKGMVEEGKKQGLNTAGRVRWMLAWRIKSRETVGLWGSTIGGLWGSTAQDPDEVD